MSGNSLKTNVVASYLGQIYVALVGLAMLPLYVRYMGAEAYGLVGFFTMLQAWFQLLDLGLTPTVSRELARYRAGALEVTAAVTMVRTLEWFFSVLGLVCGASVVLGARWVAVYWIKPQHLASGQIRLCVMLMGGAMTSRWLVGLYRGGLVGMERMVTLNLVGIVLATLRSVGVLAVLMFWTSKPSGFFIYQLGIGILELVMMKIFFYRTMPMTTAPLRPQLQIFRRNLHVAGSMAFLAGLWIVISQADRLILSGLLNLQNYGYFTVAVTLAGGISLLAAPMGQALQSRFAMLAAQNELTELIRLYRASTQLTSAVVFAIAGVFICARVPIIWAWTGNVNVAEAAGQILPMYALGNAVGAILALAFLVQFAFGTLRWHVIGNCLFGLLWVPGVYVAASRAGAIGSGWMWLTGNLAYLIFWLPYVHSKVLPSLKWRWLICDVGLIALVETLLVVLVSGFDWAVLDRVEVFATMVVFAGVLALAGILAGGEARPAVLRIFQGINPFVVKKT